MKKFIGNTAMKILAVFLSFIVFFSMVISLVGCVTMFMSDFYTRDFETLEQNIMKKLAKKEMYNLVSLYDEGNNAVESYYEDKNILYVVENNYTGEKISNFSGQNYLTTYSISEYVTRYVNGEKGDLYYSSEEVNYNPDTNQYYFYADNNVLYETNHKVNFTIYIPSDMQFTDRFFLVDKLINIGYANRYTAIFIAIVSLALSIVVFAFLFIFIGHNNNYDEIKVAPFNNIPIDIFSVFVFFMFLYGGFLFTELNTLIIAIVLGAVIITIFYFVTLWYLLSVVVQSKAKILIKRTFLFWLFKKFAKIGEIIKHIYKNISTIYKVMLIVGVFWAITLIFMGLNAYENDTLIIGFIVISAIATAVILFWAIAFQRVKQGGEKIVNGDLENKIDTTYMFGDIKDFADSLNNINQGLQSAIDDKIKSERFKTELITNVSHDIKTPLTSIINYVDLIKKENCNSEKINEYIEVLDRQSNRLKKLIEDLIEVSKASTGNLSVQLEKCNLSELVNQAIGEFSERFELKNLYIVQELAKEDVYIMADGRRLWRIFDNILNNIYKYAMSSTRVFINLFCDNNKAVITFKNISELPINLSSTELTERFVRGDRSRNTEGSGLGISIAKSLTELQNGIFDISIDGDLFKVKLTFDIVG